MSLRSKVALALSVALLVGCATYTTNTATKKMTIPEEQSFQPTSLEDIKAPEKALREQEERLEAEKRASEARQQELDLIKKERDDAIIRAQKAEAAIARIYADQAAKAQAERERIAAEKAAAEEKARLEAEAKEKAEEERLAAEKAAAEERARKEAERIAAEKAAEEAKAKAEAEAKAKAEEERIAAEKAAFEEQMRADAERLAAEKAALEAEARARAERLNEFPEDLSAIAVPHIYRPADTMASLDPAFTRVDVMLISLGRKKLPSDEIDRIVEASRDMGLEFTIVNGDRENLVEFARKAGVDSVLLETSLILFTPEIREADERSALFVLSSGKELEIGALDISDGMVEARNLEVNEWKNYILNESAAKKAEVDRTEDMIGNGKAILALSSSEPSTLDWSIFTPFTYRDDTSWPISDSLNANWSDTYRSTHFSEEVDAGATFESSSVTERLDFLYTRGILEVSSDTIALSGLSDGEIQRLATVATYLIP
ncbi:MAG: hypothetical protein IJ831_04215 [Spirochaetales bacterium]|nr:hypothetical protein [Spirochaetales bacterium]